MSRISSEEVLHIANLARLQLEPSEIEPMARDMNRMLEYVEALNEVDTSGVEPTAHTLDLETPIRKDEAVAGMNPELALEGAPERSGTAFSVPKVLEGEER